MTTCVWRIAVEGPNYSATDSSGEGARISGGRWNRIGTPIVYASQNIALAALETVAHLRAASLPFNRYLIRFDIPADVWNRRIILDPLPAAWDALPVGLASLNAGDGWVREGRSALLQVPSVIVPDEFNVLINPMHPDVPKISAVNLRRWEFDPRFFK